MHYISTRDSFRRSVSFTDILLGGLAADGGLYLPEEYPQVSSDQLAQWRSLLETEGYAAVAAEVCKLFIDDIPEEDIDKLTRRAYHEPVFDTPDIAPVSELGDGLFLGHLSQGPTAAFKDIAMQLLGEFFEHELSRRGETLNILGATSGDTGSSAEYAMRGRENIRVFMLTPAGRMSPFQQAQMFGLDDPNIFNIALEGVFDDCQDVVKAVSRDAEFKSKYRIGAVNSINWARLLAQVVYYFTCWLRVTDEHRPANEQRISFAVPTGNFGNVCAGHIARSMGLPIDRLTVATNENDVLDEFFRTGNYRPRTAAETAVTSSPSMDISRASNFERLIFDVFEKDAARTEELFGHRVKDGGFSLGAEEMKAVTGKFGFLSASSTHTDRLETIRKVEDTYGVLVDPHTADGIRAAWKTQAQGVETPVVCLETALPVKFSQTITDAVGYEPPVSPRFRAVMDTGRHVTDLPNDAEAVKKYIADAIERKEA